MKLLIVWDSYVARDVFAGAFESLRESHEIRYARLDESRHMDPTSPSELGLREYLGTPDALVNLVSDEDVLIVHSAPVTDRVLDASPRLRLVGCARGGPVNVDVEAATSRGVAVVSAPGRNADAVADQTLAFMIMIARRFPKAQRTLLDAHRVSVDTFAGGAFLGHDLGGHTLGLVGYGHVGRRVAVRALAFGMDVCAYDPFVKFECDDPVRCFDRLEDLVASAEFVSVHARATPDNENLFDRRMFAAMKPGSFFINTARETLVDEGALDAALSAGHLGGAALDVTRADGGARIDRLLRHENVVVTPHIGGATYETLNRGVEMVRAEVGRFAAGQSLLNLINPEAIHAE